MQKPIIFVLAALLALLTGSPLPAQETGFTTELRSRGYSLIPAPQQVVLDSGEAALDRSWQVVCEAGEEHIALATLRGKAAEFYGINFEGGGAGRIVLKVAPLNLREVKDPALLEQAYRLESTPHEVRVIGHSDQGLFYGVQSLLQLLRADSGNRLCLPLGTITDWPALELRFVHWDTKHHQKRPETLRRLIDWAAFFKVNCIGFEMEDKYEYPRHPVIGAPGAYTKAEMQELTRYALERFIQLVPQVQAPAHMAYVLKHPEFAHLRADSGSNYQICLCDEEALRLIEDMYQDMLEATPGVKFFHVSTDEVYYAGICKKCKKPYNEENRSQAWVDYANRMHAFLAARGRRMLCWVEYPVLAKHISQLPPDLINGVMGSDPEFLAAQKKAGVRQLAYSPIQGAELLFPNYFPTRYRGGETEGRLNDAARTLREGLAAGAEPIGSFAAAWDDSGLHEECFWLGWATVAQYAWSPDKPSVEQNVADFMDVFYGPGRGELAGVYRTLIEGARFFESSLDRVASVEAPPAYGNPWGKGLNPTRIDLRLDPPFMPFAWDMYLIVEPTFSRKYKDILEEAPERKTALDQAILTLQSLLDRGARNRYNLEILLSIAAFEKDFAEMLPGLARVEKLCFQAADQAYGERDPGQAISILVSAHNEAAGILERRSEMWRALVTVWEKSRYEKGRSVAGENFLHVLDDLKDHFADRRPGLEYMLAPYQRMDLEGWNARLAAFIRDYAAVRRLPVNGLED